MIFITGDTHGRIDGEKLFQINGAYKKHKSLTRNDYVIVAGDFGFIWDKNYKKSIEPLTKFDYTVLFIDGNHENFEILNSFPVEMWHGGKIHRISDNIIHLIRGQVFTIDNKTFFTFGGADSIDKYMRTEHLSWWKEEIPSEEEFEEAKNNLLEYNNKVDYIITHAINTRALTDRDSRLSVYRFKPTSINDMLEYFEQTVEYDSWFFGHYHIDSIVTPNKFALYQHIIQINTEEEND